MTKQEELDKSLEKFSLMNYLEVVKLLLDRGANVHAGHNHAIRNATSMRHPEIVKLLLDRGARYERNQGLFRKVFKFIKSIFVN